MQWYSRLYKEAQRPPAYLIERISDLEHAIEVSRTSPTDAKAIIQHVADRLRTHHDIEYADTLDEAVKALSDSPARSSAIISKVISMMILSKDLHDEAERKKSWKSLLT